MERPCDVRATAKNNAYTREELVVSLKNRNILPHNHAVLSKAELCKLFYSSKEKAPKLSNKDDKKPENNEHNLFGFNICKDNSKLYTQEEIFEHLKKKGVVSGDNIGMSKNQLCDLLEPRYPRNCGDPKNPNVKLTSAQMKVVDYMRTHRGLLVVQSTGSGKTLMAAAVANCFLNASRIHRVILITKAKLILNFLKEVTDMFMMDPELQSRITCFSKEMFLKKFPAHSSVNFQNTLIIFDESHILRTFGSEIAKSVIEASKTASKVLLLTATPMVNKPSDLVNQITIVNGRDDKIHDKEFDNIISKDEFLLRKYLKDKIFVNLDGKKDEYPERVDEKVIFEMTPEYYTKYNIIETQTKYKYEKLGEFDPTSIRFYIDLRKASLSLDGMNSPKILWTLNKIATDALEGYKSVVFSAFKEYGIHVIARVLTEKGIPFGIITGEVNDYSARKYVEMYNNDDISILLLSTAGGTGIDLKGTRNMIMLEYNWSESEDEQVIARAIRHRSHSHLPKDQQKVYVYRLYMIKPKYVTHGKTLSIDQILEHLAYTEKKPIIDEVLNMMKKLSI